MRAILKCAALAAGLALGLALSFSGFAQERFIILASTTSTENSGLFRHILPIFEAKTGIDVRVVAVGTGQALQFGRAGDADVLLVHDETAELRFVAEGYGAERREVMYNDFVIVGPKEDPAGIRGMTDAVEAFRRIAVSTATFVSRGDDSGTNRTESRIWDETGIDVDAVSGSWYYEAGAGMGATLNLAAGGNAYTLSDRATWLSFKNRRGLEILVEGDPRLFNQYGVILVNPERDPGVKKEEGLAFIDWITSPEGQAAIASYKIEGEQLFFPNSREAASENGAIE